MSSRARVNPFDQGSAERVLFDRYRKAKLAAEQGTTAIKWMVADHQRRLQLRLTEIDVHRGTAERYAEALRALGHGDKVPQLPALPDYSKIAE